MTILLIILIIVLLGGGGGYYAHGRYGGPGKAAFWGWCLLFLLCSGCRSLDWRTSGPTP
jgi:hypothetical protein